MTPAPGLLTMPRAMADAGLISGLALMGWAAWKIYMVLVGENGKKPSSDLTFLYGKYEKIDRDRYIYIYQNIVISRF